MHSIFVSDLHLCPTRPAINRIFLDFLRGPAARAEALYILGDLFEYWAGDDDGDPFNASVLAALRELSGHGVTLYLMHGNRDFLIGGRFSAACGAQLLPDPTRIDLYGTPTLLMHGDTLCTDDVRYQDFRAKVRTPEWQQQFLSQPLASRKQIIAGLRAENAAEKKLKSEAIMDVTVATVEARLRDHGYPRLIHGHTHRPALHEHTVDGKRCERWVLADWYTSGSYLQCDAQGCRVVKLPAVS
ncbi:MAG: UDP-2,3-diacylglucosamine diphosphatase [Betaproteobacteria bacterium]|nr:UDP-2,3-diacylglucosamine diphosphatase [Betaproteobacteria bacterium]MBI3054911.1 UDP-2,3-diacylglucosamine diphosphatase [Betaproteobacteria bacterium]